MGMNQYETACSLHPCICYEYSEVDHMERTQ